MKRLTPLLSLLPLFATSLFAAPGINQRSTSQYTVGSSLQPLVIMGEGWSQQFTIINCDYYSGEPTVGVLRFYRADGTPWRIAIRDRGTVDQIPVSLRKGEMLMVETEVSNAPQQLGWVYFDLDDSTDLWGIYHASTTFRKQTAGRPDLMTSVPFVEDLEDDWIIPMDNRDGKFPGLALVNSSTRTETYTLDVYDSLGGLKKSFRKTVPARNLVWFSLLSEHPDLAGVVGQITVRGGFLKSAVFTLQFTPNGAFTALPVGHTFGL